ncbi:hypothetical protein CY34DRAFT_813913 [Suillus luteus UH-Slu-Lm8-n1]|uniref:Uncharacterized protein n=1 Tax=Suillus luteus UH-Slu-Lm8-n1 TaxID=930992 RepID=A0A0C9Z6C8_9AGAM|nr:hypothetical protein CY34DRAFT_813913 [Suillus luteus UH-Slu-Lm8-n1]
MAFDPTSNFDLVQHSANFLPPMTHLCGSYCPVRRDFRVHDCDFYPPKCPTKPCDMGSFA